MSKESLQILKIVYGFLSSLTDEQLNNLVTKKARIKYENTRTVKPLKKIVADVDKICSEIDAMTTCEQAREYLDDLNLDRAALIEITKHYSIPIRSKETNTQLLDKIVENTVGSKLRYNTLLNVKLH